MSPDFVGTLKPPRLATAPGSAVVGQSYYDTVLNAVRYWNGTAWVTTDLRYNGDWAAGSYTDGDIVVYNSTSYLCVRPTSSAPAGWTPVYSATGYGTSLPASPVDGQEYVLVDSTTAPTYNWRLRYNSGSSSAYRWEMVGGTPAYRFVYAAEAVAAGSWVNATTPGPDFVVPRAGDYLCSFQATFANPNASLDMVAVANTAAPTTTIGVTALETGGSGAYVTPVSIATETPAVPAGQTLRLVYNVSGASVTVGPRALTILPRRVA